MNLFNIIDEIENVDPEFQDRISPRRAAIKNITSFGSKVAVAALPFAFSTLFKKAYGQTSGTAVNDVLNFALTLEYLEAEYYATGVSTAGLIPAGAGATALAQIAKDEANHVAFLKSVLGSAAVSKPTFDFTAKNTFPDVFSNYQTFLKVALAFEDTGVRAYKGQAGNLKGNKVVLTAALNIHSVEARHASHLRQMVAANVSGASALKPWIAYTANGNDTGIAAVNPVYAGEQNTTQANVNVTGFMGASGNISQSAAAEAFDEPLTKDAVLAIAGLFIV
ncbi:ferritin-like domain-containing protein [Pedobacter sp. HMF7647]|uniref:Ferritin-like domain-containing protein n=1 Tax=Hufsiella arboris TaxID=2695275 RepID=A0A7K1Y711_9SPHI|nr:ferritin-like domain-containing protein [Hufsiella arboris]MXV50230.1 ferritin-like domain-containing protein [Hufsiella arboris]